MHTFKWLIFCLISLQLSLCHRRSSGPAAITDELNQLPQFTDPVLTTNQPSIYLNNGGQFYKLVKPTDEYPYVHQSFHRSDGQFDMKSSELIAVIQSNLMAKSDHQSNENYLEHNEVVNKSNAPNYHQPDYHTDHHMDHHMDQQPNDYDRNSVSYQPTSHPHSNSHHRPYSHRSIKPYKPVYVTHPDKVNPLLILAQDTIRLQEEMLFAMMPHSLRSYLIRLMDGQMGKLKGSKNTQYDPDHAWFGKGILVKAKKPYGKYGKY